jgi:glutathione peroxidase
MTTALIKFIATYLVSFHSLSFKDVNNVTINMSSFSSKKVMLVNIATGSARINQLAGLKQLQQQYADSLQIIVFPSNSFGKETRTDAQIKQFLQPLVGNTIIIAAKSDVINSNANAVFKWLASKNKNGDMDALAGGDFEKFVVGKDGTIYGIFSSKVSPTDPSIISTITSTF